MCMVSVSVGARPIPYPCYGPGNALLCLCFRPSPPPLCFSPPGVEQKEKPLLSDYALKGIPTLAPADQKRALRMFSRKGIKAGNASNVKE